MNDYSLIYLHTSTASLEYYEDILDVGTGQLFSSQAVVVGGQNVNVWMTK